LFPNKFSSLPLALVHPSSDSPDNIVTGPENIKNITTQYFTNLYHCTQCPPQPKPWMGTPSITMVASQTHHDPFSWPTLLDLPNLHLILGKGNRRPTPGPDGWEKWFLCTLSDNSLLHVIPSCQVATQPGVQGRDLLSVVAQVQKWGFRQDIPLYILQCDQKKGFDMLEPQGFYDALTAYGLPDSIAALDQSSQTDVPYSVKTAYGFTDLFIVNGVMKQGGSLSPLKCTLTTSMCHHWLSDLSTHLHGCLLLQSQVASQNTLHTPLDCIIQPVTYKGNLSL
ncbi:hypothetical protein L208DRAFT_1308867, partial [Tricholoma matsutake]